MGGYKKREKIVEKSVKVEGGFPTVVLKCLTQERNSLVDGRLKTPFGLAGVRQLDNGNKRNERDQASAAQ